MIIIPIIIAVILIFLFYRKTIPELDNKSRYLLFFLRTLAIITVLILLFNPIYYFLKNIVIKPEVLILSDISASMEQKQNDISKTEILQTFQESMEKELSSKNYKIIKFKFAEGLDGSLSSTNFSKTLSEISAKHDLSNVKNVLLFSDGWFKDENLNILENIDIPVFTFSPEFKAIDFDLQISRLKYNKTTYTEEITPIIANVSTENYDGKAKLILKINGRKIQTEEIDFGSDNFQQIVFEHNFQKTGLIPFEVNIIADSTGEINFENNRFPATIQVLDKRSKILVISDKLNWDVKFVIDAIQKNPRWNAEFLMKDKILKQGKPRVKLQEKIENVKVIFLINSQNLNFNNEEIEIINSFTKNGGGLFLQGNPISELAELYPAKKSNIRKSFKSNLYFTKESKQYRSFDFNDQHSADNIPPVDYYYVAPKLQAKVLAKIENEEQSPAILFQEYEQGKILYFAFQNLWKWQLWDSEQNYTEFISNLCSWLGQRSSDRFISYTDKNSYFAGENIKFRLNAYDEKLSPMQNLNAKLIIKNEDKKIVLEKYLIAREDEYFLEIESPELGKYSYKISDENINQETDGEFLVTAYNPENRDRGFNIPLLSYIALQTGGKMIDKKDLEQFDLPKAIMKNEELRTEIPIYKKWFIIAIFLLAFCLELYLRKRWGLL